MERVTYKLHPTYQDYLIGSDGSVWSTKKGVLRQIKCYTNIRTGYVCARLHRGGHSRNAKVQHLVLEAFFCQRPQGMECRHLDGNKKNNCIENLVWGTRKENESDKIRHGTRNIGERNGRSKLSEEDVVRILRLLNAGWLHRDIAGEFGVTRNLITAIGSGKRWRHLLESAT